jgi:hypothetical protein
LAFLAWVIVLIGRKHSGLILIAFSIAMFLVGAGFGPRLLGLLLGASATRLNSPGGTRSNVRWRTFPRQALALVAWRGPDRLAVTISAHVLAGYIFCADAVPDTLVYALMAGGHSASSC